MGIQNLFEIELEVDELMKLRNNMVIKRIIFCKNQIKKWR